ncbi:rhomboid family intramembrane serine protease [Planotetraspora sp. A-T 1434]|uniref:rhomboid family intramembrane serine protease n=1 Tax=Planotetraspora sp. A-T 1434 TaxID=2979219 RepID=UPI0021C1613A|nr:rhomboid family intramembrane serine protease [Planotetraspora sp. A-T 1434]MCT9935076.1 rhomboid family intramembrane serine protease [Planotetraspora sp. A-T 1434]
MTDGRTAEIMIAEARKAFWVMVGFLGLIWVVQIVNWADGYGLSYHYGIRAWDVDRLPGIVSAPLLHWSWAHIEGNSGPLFIFGFLAAYRGVRKFLGVTGLIALASGLGSWFTADSSAIGAGASGLVFGYFGYVLVRGAFDRHLIDIVIGLVMGLCFAYQFAGLLPAEGIGWQAHVFGFVGGIVGGYLFRDRRPAEAPKAATGDSRSALLKEIEDLGL